MPYILKERINVGISACNFGARVRWNWKGWDRIAHIGRDRDAFNWTPVCPEVMAGLGVGRATIKLTGGTGRDFWNNTARVTNRGGRDVSTPMAQGCRAALDTLTRAGCEAFVFMEGSPSCGVYRTTLKNKRLGKPPGTFGSLLLDEDLFLIPAQDLESPVKWWDWRRRLHAFAWLVREEITTKKQLYDIWHRYKFMCQEVDRKEADAIGRTLAAMPRLNQQDVTQWKSRTLKLLRKPSTLARIKSIMQKHAAHYNKHFQGHTDTVVIPADEQSKRRFVAHLVDMEKRAFLENYDFAGVPVLFRGGR